MNLKITVMGCGNSSGVPAVGNFWGACDPNEPRNRRTRCALAVQSQTTTLIIDTGPDFREQTNRFNINTLNAILYSHIHSDHVNGIDDTRGFFFRNQRQPLNVYASAETFAELTKRFDFMFDGGNNEEFYPPILKANPYPENAYGRVQTIGDIEFIPYKIDHGTCTVTGYRFGDFAYSVDMKTMDETALNTIKGIKTWVVDAAAYKNANNFVHANLETVYEYNKTVKAQEVYISSLSTLMDYKTLQNELPKGFFPAYDGLTFEIQQ